MDKFFRFEGTCLLTKARILKEGKRLIPEIDRIKAALRDGYDTEYASVNLPRDKILLDVINKAVQEKKALSPSILVVVGIGGSNLGTIAVHEAINGKTYNDKEPQMRVFFPDTVDADGVGDIVDLAREALEQGEDIIVNVVTKTGKTTETIALFEIFAELLKEYKGEDYKDYVVATTDRDSRMWRFAMDEGYTLLEIPEQVGGRYSVFSAVGLFPLGMLGLDIAKLQEGAESMLALCVDKRIDKNPAAISALITYLHNRKGRCINDNFIFSSDLEAIGKWYRQLMGESIGKVWDRAHKRKVHTGMTPTVSIGSTDLHSMAQLYLGGPQDKLTAFIRVDRNKHILMVPHEEGYNRLVEDIQGKDLKGIMDAILEGVEIAFKKAKRPFVEIALPDKSEFSIAQMLQFKMLEMMYLAHLLGVNPFDQPNVEAYKKETRKILSS